MPTQCSATGMAFGRAGGRELVAAFDGGRVTSEAGALLLGATDQAIRLVDRFASCFRDSRHPAFVTHRVRSLVGQRIFGLALGYEDLVDHDDLCHDPVLGALLGRFKPDDATPALFSLARARSTGWSMRLSMPRAGAITRSGMTWPRSRPCLSTSSSMPSGPSPRARSSWTSTRPMTRSTGIRKAAFSMATMIATATCRFTC